MISITKMIIVRCEGPVLFVCKAWSKSGIKCVAIAHTERWLHRVPRLRCRVHIFAGGTITAEIFVDQVDAPNLSRRTGRPVVTIWISCDGEPESNSRSFLTHFRPNP